MIDNTSPRYYHEPHGTQQGENEHDWGCMTTLIKTSPRGKNCTGWQFFGLIGTRYAETGIM